jgi:N-acetyl-anhydromuramyl-L-alanine amidase AmpD
MMDPNMRTIAIEITGYDFENPEHYPGEQQIANVVGVVWAVMKRYGIPAMNIWA